VDETSDLYALGATLLHLLSRKPPQALLTPRMELAFEGHLHVSPPFATFLRRLVAVSREERFPSAATALRALEALKGGRARPSRRSLALTGAAVLLLGGYLAAWPSVESWLLRRHEPAGVLVGRPGTQRSVDDSQCNNPKTCAPMCEQGRASACSKLASMYTHGLGVTPDAAKALALEERACALNSPESCVFLGYKLREGKLGPRDLPRARQLFTQGCEEGVADGCEALAEFYESGNGVPQDMSRYVELMERACDLGDLYACANGSYPYRDGAGNVARNPRRAERLLRKSCDGGLAYGCEKLADFRARSD
jgi:hypothetical protein